MLQPHPAGPLGDDSNLTFYSLALFKKQNKTELQRDQRSRRGLKLIEDTALNTAVWYIVVKRVYPKNSHHKENVFFFSLYLYEMTDAN